MRRRGSAFGAVLGSLRSRLSASPRLFSASLRRAALERGLRAVALLSLLALLLLSLRDLRAPSALAADDVDGTRGLRAALARWSTREAPASVRVALDAVPAPVMRDWIAALAGAGTRVAWSGRALPATALAVEPVADPARPSRVLVAAPDGRGVALEDALGPLDSLSARGGGAALTALDVRGRVRARVAGAEATAAVRDSLVLRRVLVLGRAGWEAKFAAAALAERGWAVDARLAVSPAGDAVQGSPGAIDTARYAAVVALDTTAARLAPRVAVYVRAGGGLVIAGEAAATPGLAALLAAAPGGAPSPPGRFAADS
ncbi:MAG: hypothetical protein ACJ8AO_18685, partial [Gemmatimonadaceae bacterium]